MACIYVDLNEVRNADYDLLLAENKAAYVKRRLKRIKSEIPECVASRYEIGQRLEGVCKEIGNIEKRIAKLYEAVDICMEQYEYAEYENEKNAGQFFIK